VAELLREAWRYLSGEAEARGIELERPENVDLVVRAEHRALRQALINLAGEAIALARNGGSVRLGAAGEGGEIALVVRVTGTIAPDATFEPAATPSLPVAVARALIERLGGRLETAKEGDAVVATCLLPMAGGRTSRLHLRQATAITPSPSGSA
jgi:C4-dicarboxylate-specific signal transduction histidine kinase